MSKNILLILIRHENIRYHSGVPRPIISYGFMDWVFSSINNYFWRSSYNTKKLFFSWRGMATR